MENSDVITLVLISLIPAALVFGANMLIIKRFFEKEKNERRNDLSEINRKKTLPLRLQAYERLVLYLERINPENSILKTYKAGMSANLLQAELLKQIRSEFDHNMAQQVYISDQVWDIIKTAKEETIKIINIAAQQCKAGSTGVDLSNNIYKITSEIKELPTIIASKALKKEARILFR